MRHIHEESQEQYIS